MTRIGMSCGKPERQKCCRPAGFTIAWLNVLARRANDAALVARIQERAAVRVDRQFARSHRLTLVELGAMVVGTVMCVLLWLRRNEPSSFVRLHEPGVPPPWPGGIGAAVLLRGGAIGAMLTALFLLYVPPDNAWLRSMAIPLTNVPLLLLALPSSVPAFRDDVR